MPALSELWLCGVRLSALSGLGACICRCVVHACMPAWPRRAELSLCVLSPACLWSSRHVKAFIHAACSEPRDPACSKDTFAVLSTMECALSCSRARPGATSAHMLLLHMQCVGGCWDWPAAAEAVGHRELLVAQHKSCKCWTCVPLRIRQCVPCVCHPSIIPCVCYLSIVPLGTKYSADFDQRIPAAAQQIQLSDSRCICGYVTMLVASCMVLSTVCIPQSHMLQQ